MVLRIYFYKPESEEYSVLRKDALEAIAKTAAYNLNVVEAGYGYSIQTRMFERGSDVETGKFREKLHTYPPCVWDAIGNRDKESILGL